MKESELSKSIKDYCQYMENLGKCILVRNNTFEGWLCSPKRKPPPEYSPHYIKQGKKDSGDFFLILHGMVVMIETKVKGKNLTPGQIDFKKKAEALGMRYFKVTELDQIIGLIKEGENEKCR